MITAVDTSVILDVLSDQSKFCEASEEILRQARHEGKLIFCGCVVAEIYPAFNDELLFKEFISDWQLHFVPSSFESAFMAGKYFTKYLQGGGIRKRVLPDFLIGSHAALHADRLCARDRGYLRDYFTELTVMDPTH